MRKFLIAKKPNRMKVFPKTAEEFLYSPTEFGGHGQLRGGKLAGKGRGTPATGELVAWQT